MEVKNKFGRFWVLLRFIPNITKEEMIWSYSNMLTTSLKDFATLKPEMFNKMLEDMEKMATVKSNDFVNLEIKKYRSACLLRMQKIGINTADWKAVNVFLENKKIAGEPLWKLSVEQMKTLICKLESIYAKQISQKKEITRLMKCN